MPTISLIVPIYNVAPYIERCVESISKQTFQDFEVIFVNDGSTDDSAVLCKNAIVSFPYMRLISKDNGGLSSARLAGFKIAKGAYISFIDSDDYLHPDYLRLLHESLIGCNSDISMCAYYTDNGVVKNEQRLYFNKQHLVIEEENILSDYILTQLPSIETCKNELPSFMWLRLFRKELITEDLFISERSVFQEDLAFSLLSFNRVKRISILNIPLYYYCINQGSLTLKYRSNAWNMMCNMYGMINTFLKDEDSFILNKKDSFLMSAVLFALRNASIKDYRNFMETLRIIKEDMNVKQLLRRRSLCDFHGRYKFLFILLSTRLTPLLFFKYKYM